MIIHLKLTYDNKPETNHIWLYATTYTLIKLTRILIIEHHWLKVLSKYFKSVNSNIVSRFSKSVCHKKYLMITNSSALLGGTNICLVEVNKSPEWWLLNKDYICTILWPKEPCLVKMGISCSPIEYTYTHTNV